MSFSEALGKTHSVDIAGQIQNLRDGSWLDALTISFNVYLQARDGQGNVGCESSVHPLFESARQSLRQKLHGTNRVSAGL